jgi:hypothetical protein
MNIKSMVVAALIVVSAAPLNAAKKKQPERVMLEKMEAVTCGARQRGLTGLGSIWASVGVTHVNSDEKLCPQYLLRTDDMEYEIRPTDGKHAAVLPVGHEGLFKIKGDKMFLKFEDGDKKTRSYMVVAERPNDTEGQSSKSYDRSDDKSDVKSADKSSDR